MSRPVTVKIGGETHTVDLDEALHIHNADAERHTVAADMAWWGVLAAEAKARVAKLSAAAASWHAAALVTCLQQEEKISEWKAKAMASAHEEYKRIQNDIADAQAIEDKCSAIHWAFVRKMDMLREMIKGEVGDKRGANDVGRMPAPTQDGPDPRLSKYRNNRQNKEE
jgi:hypothetical protein